MNILDLLQQDGITTKKVSGTNGGENAGPCPMCGGSDRFRSWPEQGEGGKWWCRGCGKGGDLIQYLKEVRGMAYPEACELLGREPAPKKRTLNWNRQPTAEKWQPRKVDAPVVVWTEKASSFVSWAKDQLWSEAGREALEWLRTERGLTGETIKAFSLGWNPKRLFRTRSSWGLDEQIKENGKPKKLWLPRGLVIPSFNQSGQVIKVKVRRPEPDADPRYYLLPGSTMQPLIAPGGPAAIVIESELDLFLLHQAAGDLVSTLALGSATIRPDEETHGILTSAESILVALDGDQAGAKAAWQWWLKTYPRAKRWPPIKGKDPCEMFKAGVDLRVWVKAGLPEPILQAEQTEIEAELKPNREPVPVYPEQKETSPSVTQKPSETDENQNQDQDLFKYLLSDIRGGGAYSRLWPGMRNYCRRTLGRNQFQQLQSAYEVQQKGANK